MLTGIEILWPPARNSGSTESAAWCVKARDPLSCSSRVIYAPKSLSISATQLIIQYIEPLSGRPNFGLTTCALSSSTLIPKPLSATLRSIPLLARPRAISAWNLEGKETKRSALFVFPRFHSDDGREGFENVVVNVAEQKGMNGVTFHRRCAS